MKTFFPENEMLLFNVISRLGTAYVIFLVKSNTDILLKSKRKIWAFGLSSFFAPLVISVIFSLLMKEHFSNCMNQSRTLFVGAALSVTYFPVVAQFIDELNLLTTEFGLLTLSSSMLIQVLSICMVILGVCSTRKTYMLSLQYLLGVFGTLLFAVFIIRPTIKDVIKRTPEGKPVHEYFVTAFLLGTLIMAFITDYLWQFPFRSFSYGVDHPRWTTFGFHISREI